ncbi:uncharacterized protein EV422DRAFT_254758 [Fimicolochytrium jonesii]|uniref:uncharacterized protein n=1 Tax=Fimicolochytrium jonesii TaxID=1396493 RepID=UPI0022FE74D2|nr:uncharacterized protein EV422DRAFT_254758 [Fimicolochytrium jonesii]KAI8825312.1 hypothetical protein EV422DRAFT_254758 [Fimicolochytrium jonesii]
MATTVQPADPSAAVQVDDDDDQHLQTEDTPLLRGETQQQAANGTYPDHSDLLIKATKNSWKQWLCLGLLVLTFATSVAFLCVYFIYIPHKLRDALAGNDADVRGVHIVSLNPDGVVLSMNAVAHNDEIPPVDVTMQPTLFSLLKVDNTQESHESHIVGSMQFPGLEVAKGSPEVPIEFVSSVDHLNVPVLRELIRAALNKSADVAPVQMFVMQASPMMTLHGLGSWIVPMQNAIVFDKNNVSTPDTSKLNASVTYNVTMESLSVYKINIHASFDNPTVVSYAPQPFSLQFSMFYDGTRVMDFVLPPTTHLTLGRNTNLTVLGTSLPAGIGKLMEFVGKYAAGDTTTVLFKRFRPKYVKKMHRLRWLEEVLKEVDFEVEVPGATEADDLRWVRSIASVARPLHAASASAKRLGRRWLDHFIN